jgi:GDP/UDP-N,N'-diacetylbacillosamine 2-epimerase (hydrolysing)
LNKFKLNPRKITITTGSRSEYGILRPIITKLQNNKNFKLYLLVTGTHMSKKYGNTISEIKKDGFKPYSTFSLIPSGNDNYYMAKSIGDGILEFGKIFRKIKPDINLILGDRAEMFASAIAAFYMNIPNAHIHGGDVSGSVDEYTRHAITKISNIHFAATEKSQKRIIKMGENPKLVFLTGSPSIDEITENKITTKNQLNKKYNLNISDKTIILLYHPSTTKILKSKNEIKNILNAIVKIKHETIIISPNSDTGRNIIYNNLKEYSKRFSFLHIYPTFPRHDYLGLLKNAGVLVGNSSSGIIEANYLGIPVVNIGNRQHNREKSKNVLDIEDNSVNSIKNILTNTLRKKSIDSKFLYGRGNASKKIINILEKIRLDNDLIQKELFY